jgi:hypothetical protein
MSNIDPTPPPPRASALLYMEIILVLFSKVFVSLLLLQNRFGLSGRDFAAGNAIPY